MNSRAARVAPLLFGSGTCALIYQIVWLRQMRFIFGASTAASAAVLAIFMGGLGLGGALLGRRADRHPRPLAFYGHLEALIALSAALTPALVWLARRAYILTGGSVVLGLAGATLTRLFLAALVLCVPTFLMGGTLPAAARAVETEDDASRRNLAVLYGVNTLGAVTGAFVSTFLLLEIFGTRMTLWLACLVNIGVALGAVVLARTLGAGTSDQTQQAQSRQEEAVRRAGTDRNSVEVHGFGSRRQKAKCERLARRDMPPPTARTPDASPAAFVEARSTRVFALFAAGVVGFAFLLMELVWYRMMGPLLGGSSFTFGLILAVALLGIGLGGTAYALFGSSRPATLAGFAFSCILESLCIAYPYALGDHIAFLTIAMRSLGSLGFYGLVLGWTLVAALVILPAAFVAGVQFPLLIALLGRGSDNVGRDTGLAYAWNTVGAIIGSLAGGFGLLPLLSAPGTWKFVVGLLLALGLGATAMSAVTTKRWRWTLVPLGSAVATILLLFATGPTAVWRHSAIGAGRANLSDNTPNGRLTWTNDRRRAIQWEADGVESAVALEAIDGYDFLVNGKVDGNSLSDAPTQVMAGLIGAILHPNPRRALVIGLGTGSTAGWLASIPSIERVDVVELEPSMLRVAQACAPVNRGVLTNPKVHIFIGDAREVLLTTPQRYDIIFSEPSNPYRAGVASLFTKEFYEAVAARLADGGVFSQWLQSYEVDQETIRLAYGTMVAVFPAVETWQTHFNDLLLVASLQPLVYDVGALRARVEQEPFKTALSAVWFATGLEGLLSRYLANSAFSRAVAAQQGPVLNTDDRTPMEFAFARSVGNNNIFSLQDIYTLARARKENRPALQGGEVDWLNVEDQRINMMTADGDIFEVEPGLTADQRLRAVAQNLYTQGQYDGSLVLWRKQSQEPAGPLQLAVVAEALADAGNDDALNYISQLRTYQPAEADALLARLRTKQGRLPEATDALEAAFKHFQSDPWLLTRVMGRAMDLSVDIATKDKELGQRLYKLFATPLAVRALEAARLITRRQLAAQLDFEGLCVETFAPYEPYPAWTKEFLTGRLRCYRTAADPRVAQAQTDLDAFERNVQVPFSQGLQPASEGS